MEQPTNPTVITPQPAIPARKPWAVGRREWRLLPLSLALAYLLVSFFLDWHGRAGFGAVSYTHLTLPTNCT